MKTTERDQLVIQIAKGLGIPADSPTLGECILDRLNNLMHQAQHVQILYHCLKKNRALNARNAELRAILQQSAQAPSAASLTHPLFHIFNACVRRAQLDEAGLTHGSKPAFWKLTWVELAENYGSGFLYAQAMQKLREAQHLDPTADGRTKHMEAINYIAMGLLHEGGQDPIKELK